MVILGGVDVICALLMCRGGVVVDAVCWFASIVLTSANGVKSVGRLLVGLYCCSCDIRLVVISQYQSC